MSTYQNVSTTTALEGAAKEIYPIEAIKELEQRDTSFLKEVDETSELEFSPVEEGSFNFAVMASSAHGQKMINQQEALPRGKPSNVVQGKAFVKEYAGVIEFTKRGLELGKKNPAVYADFKTIEMESLITNAGKYFNRQIANGTGVGTMTLIQGAQAIGQTVIEVDDATPFQIGMVLDFWDSAGTTKQNDQLVVEDIDIFSSPNTITLTEALPVASDDNGIICIAGARDNASTDGKEFSGMPLVTDDGTLKTTFQNIIRTGAGETPNYRGISLDASGAPLNENLISQIFTRSKRVASTNFSKISDCYWLISPEQLRAYMARAIPQIHFAPKDKMDLAGSYGEPEQFIAGKRVVEDDDVDRNSAYIIRKTAVKMAVARALDWESDLGGTSLKWLSGYPQGIMLLYALQQFFSESPREAARIYNLASVSI